MHEYSSVYVLDCNNDIVIPEFPLMDYVDADGESVSILK